MLDRVPLYPGRVKLTPVSGQENVYDMVRADQPTQPGDPLNKATLLKDATAALFGLGTDAVPDDMLNALAHTGDLHVWKRTRDIGEEIPATYQLGERQSSVIFSAASSTNVSIYYGDSLSVTPEGVVSIANEQLASVDSGSDISAFSFLKGKYIRVPDYQQYLRGVALVNDDAVLTKNPTYTLNSSSIQKVVGIPAAPPSTHIDYPVSPNRNAYQEGDNSQPAGYTLGDVQNGQFKLTTDSDLYSPSILYSYGSSVYVGEDGSLSLSSPDGSVSATREQYEYNLLLLKGKFIQANTPGSNNWIGDFQVGKIFFIPETATLDKLSNGTPFFSQIQTVTGYPAIPADTTIEYMSQLGDKARIVTGSYVGTGQYGSENPNSLTFEFAPKVLFIIASMGASSSVGEHMWKAEFYLNGVFSSYKSNGYFLRNDTSLLSSNSLFSMLNSGGKSVLWYGSDARTQLNATEETYYYTAIG